MEDYVNTTNQNNRVTFYNNYSYFMSEHPFTNDKQFFSSIPVDKRSEYINKMLATPHPDGEAFMPNVNYPYENTFSYKTYTLNYYHTELHP